jgi:hypothetical protein
MRATREMACALELTRLSNYGNLIARRHNSTQVWQPN